MRVSLDGEGNEVWFILHEVTAYKFNVNTFVLRSKSYLNVFISVFWWLFYLTDKSNFKQIIDCYCYIWNKIFIKELFQNSPLLAIESSSWLDIVKLLLQIFHLVVHYRTISRALIGIMVLHCTILQASFDRWKCKWFILSAFILYVKLVITVQQQLAFR